MIAVNIIASVIYQFWNTKIHEFMISLYTKVNKSNYA